jgi:hypothetical protein
MLAAAAAGADIVDVAIDSASFSSANDELDVQISNRYVWTDITALDGRRMHGT